MPSYTTAMFSWLFVNELNEIHEACPRQSHLKHILMRQIEASQLRLIAIEDRAAYGCLPVQTVVTYSRDLKKKKKDKKNKNKVHRDHLDIFD